MFFYHVRDGLYRVNGEIMKLSFAGHTGGESSLNFWADLSPSDIEELEHLRSVLDRIGSDTYNGKDKEDFFDLLRFTAIFWVALGLPTTILIATSVLDAIATALATITIITFVGVLVMFIFEGVRICRVKRIRRRVARLCRPDRRISINDRVIRGIACAIMRPGCSLAFERGLHVDSHEILRPHRKRCCQNWQKILDYKKFYDIVGSELMARIIARNPELVSVVGEELVASASMRHGVWSSAVDKLYEIIREECLAEEQRRAIQRAETRRRAELEEVIRRHNREEAAKRAEAEADARSRRMQAALGKTSE